MKNVWSRFKFSLSFSLKHTRTHAHEHTHKFLFSFSIQVWKILYSYFKMRDQVECMGQVGFNSLKPRIFFPLTIKKQNFGSPSHFFYAQTKLFYLKKWLWRFFIYFMVHKSKMEHLAESFSSTNTAEHNYATSSAHL